MPPEVLDAPPAALPLPEVSVQDVPDPVHATSSCDSEDTTASPVEAEARVQEASASSLGNGSCAQELTGAALPLGSDASAKPLERDVRLGVTVHK